MTTTDSKPIVLWHTRIQTCADDAGIAVTKYVLPLQNIPGPYSRIGREKPFIFVPPLAYFAIKRLAEYPEQLHHLPVHLPYKPPRTSREPDILRLLLADSYTPQGTLDLCSVDPRLWVTLAQIYGPASLPPELHTYTLPLSDRHLPLLQQIKVHGHFALLTVLTLRACKQVTDETVFELKALHSLAGLDLSGTELSSYGIGVLASTLQRDEGQIDEEGGDGRRGPWKLQMLRLENCWNVDDKVFAKLDAFVLLSVVDLRGTRCRYRSVPEHSGFSRTPSGYTDLFHPTPLTAALDILSERSPRTQCYPTPDPFRLNVTSLNHHSHPALASENPKVTAEDEFVVFPPTATLITSIDKKPEKQPPKYRASFKISSSAALTREEETKKQMLVLRRKYDAGYRGPPFDDWGDSSEGEFRHECFHEDCTGCFGSDVGESRHGDENEEENSDETDDGEGSGMEEDDSLFGDDGSSLSAEDAELMSMLMDSSEEHPEIKNIESIIVTEDGQPSTSITNTDSPYTIPIPTSILPTASSSNAPKSNMLPISEIEASHQRKRPFLLRGQVRMNRAITMPAGPEGMLAVARTHPGSRSGGRTTSLGQRQDRMSRGERLLRVSDSPGLARTTDASRTRPRANTTTSDQILQDEARVLNGRNSPSAFYKPLPPPKPVTRIPADVVFSGDERKLMLFREPRPWSLFEELVSQNERAKRKVQEADGRWPRAVEAVVDRSKPMFLQARKAIDEAMQRSRIFNINERVLESNESLSGEDLSTPTSSRNPFKQKIRLPSGPPSGFSSQLVPMTPQEKLERRALEEGRVLKGIWDLPEPPKLKDIRKMQGIPFEKKKRQEKLGFVPLRVGGISKRRKTVPLDVGEAGADELESDGFESGDEGGRNQANSKSATKMGRKKGMVGISRAKTAGSARSGGISNGESQRKEKYPRVMDIRCEEGRELWPAKVGRKDSGGRGAMPLGFDWKSWGANK